MKYFEACRTYKMPSATALEYDIRVKVILFVAVKSFIVKVERDGMPDVEAFERKIQYMIEEAIIKENVGVAAKTIR